jgi:hypothetical protein
MNQETIEAKNLNWINYAWMGLGDISSLKRGNPLIRRSQEDIANPGRLEAKLMRNPDYIAFACKILLEIQLLPAQAVILQELWTKPFPMYVGSRGYGKSWLLAVYATLKCVTHPGTKIVIVGAGFRQAKVIFEYMENIWRNAPVLRDLCTNDSGPRRDVDRCTMKINLANSQESWAVAIPLGDGQKIRGLRAHIIIADEFSSVPSDIYETVVAGFAAVSASPITNVMEASRRKELARLGIWTADAELKYKSRQRNQAIISGTADYAFKPFAKYWKRYSDIINSKGDPRILQEILGMDEIPEGFDWRDFTIIRIPYELIPEGFMDDKQVIRARATINSGIFAMEYGAVFVEDSQGFFKRSLIEKCVTSPSNPVQLPSGDVWFDVSLHGSKTKQYVIGVDPASEEDNFSIIVLEICQDHSRIVYSWSTNRVDFKRRLKAGLSKYQDFYGFCARKIRDLMKAFPTIAIAMDGQGGGVSVEEALHDPDKMEPGELPIWPIVEEKEKDTDDKPGLHILHVCQFANAQWTSQANHGMRKDFEDRVLLFPRFNPITLGLATEEDGIRKKAFEKEHPDKVFNVYDTLEDCVMEIEELKTELSTIVMTQTGTGVGARDRWDTPEIKLPNGKKGKLRKDRYSALVMANMVARQFKRADPPPEYNMIGDFAANIVISVKPDNGPLYSGPEWFVDGMNEILNLNY